MRIDVQVFASLKDVVGAPTARLEIPEGCSVARLLEIFGEAFPPLQPALRSLRVAVNEEYATAEALLREGDRIALIPPVSGGCDV